MSIPATEEERRGGRKSKRAEKKHGEWFVRFGTGKEGNTDSLRASSQGGGGGSGCESGRERAGAYEYLGTM
jgi:hypothetical protein